MRVLVVDDEKLIAEDLRVEVTTVVPSADCDTANTAEAALELAETKTYDVALLDVDMPGTDGLTLARKLISFFPAINIIFVTGHKEYALEAHELYCSGFLLKPVGERKLKKAFENLRKPFVDLPEDYYEHYYQGDDLIGKKIELFRKQRGISRQELADLMNVTRQTVFRWEHGERLPDIMSFLQLARLLGVKMNELLGSKEGADPV